MEIEDDRKRRFIILSIGCAMTIIITFLSYLALIKVRENEKIQERISSFNIPPIFKLDSTKFEFDQIKPLVIVIFNSTCELCEVEVLDIKNNLAVLSTFQIILISSEPIDEIRSFSLNLGLDTEPSLFFCKINETDLYSAFGSISYPHILVYDKDRKLIKQFREVVDIKAMVKKIGTDVSGEK